MSRPIAPLQSAVRDETSPIHQRRFERSRRFWVGPLSLVFVTGLLILARQGAALELLFPVLAFLVGIFLIARFPVQFIGYALWLWFFTPEVRRFADFYRGAFNPTSPIQLAPLAVSLLTVFTVASRYKFLGSRIGLPYLLMLIGTFYAFIVGIVSNGLFPAIYAYSSWLYPILLATHMASTPERYVEYRNVLMKTFMVGGVALGVYGLIQYVLMPPWDAAWLVQSGLTSSMGLPIPFGSRLFGSLNSTGTFALAISPVILLAIVPGYRWRLLASSLGVICLALTFVRTCWGGLLISLIFILTLSDARTKIRMIFGGLVMLACVMPVFLIPTINDLVVARINTISNLQSDNSFGTRQDFYISYFTTAFSNILGDGMGALGTSARLGASSTGQANLAVNFDSGIMEIPTTLGWPGGLLFIIGLLSAFGRASRQALKHRKDRFVVAFYAAGLPLFIEMIFANTLTGTSGIVFMMSIVIPYMADYHVRMLRRRA